MCLGVVRSNIASENSGVSDVDLGYGDVTLFSWTDLHSHANVIVVGNMLQLLMTLVGKNKLKPSL